MPLAFIGSIFSYHFSPDTKSYIIAFQTLQLSEIIDSFFSFYIISLKTLFFNFNGFLVLTIYLLLVIKNFAFKKLLGISVNIFYLTSFFILHDLIQIRFALAISLYLLGVYLIHKKGKKTSGIALILISFLTHFSTLGLLIPHILMLLNLTQITTYLLGLLPLAIISFSNKLFVYLEPYLNSKLISYLYQLGYSGLDWKISKQHVYVIVFTLFFLFVYRGTKKKFVILMTIIGFSFSLPTANYPVISSRLFEIYLIILPLIQTLTFRELLKISKAFALPYAFIASMSNLYMFGINTMILLD